MLLFNEHFLYYNIHMSVWMSPMRDLCRNNSYAYGYLHNHVESTMSPCLRKALKVCQKSESFIYVQHI